MENSEVQRLVADALPDAEVSVSGDGSHFVVTVVSPEFEGQSPVVRQKRVYATLNEQITSGALHAVTIKAYTPAQWAQAEKFQVGSD